MTRLRLLLFLFALLPLLAGAATLTLRVDKRARTLVVLADGQVVRSYRVSLGSHPLGTKHEAGDGRTAEGQYDIRVRNPASRFYRSLGISYPGPDDALRGLEAGLISDSDYRRIMAAHAAGEVPPWDTRLGGALFIHGGGATFDWTDGCVALDDADMRELFDMIDEGTQVEIRP